MQFENFILEINNKMKSKCEQLLHESCFYFKDNELTEIENIIDEKIDSDIAMKMIIKNQYQEFENQDINIDGFIRFRMKYLDHLCKSIVDGCVDRYLIRKTSLESVGISTDELV